MNVNKLHFIWYLDRETIQTIRAIQANGEPATVDEDEDTKPKDMKIY